MLNFSKSVLKQTSWLACELIRFFVWIIPLNPDEVEGVCNAHTGGLCGQMWIFFGSRGNSVCSINQWVVVRLPRPARIVHHRGVQ